MRDVDLEDAPGLEVSESLVERLRNIGVEGDIDLLGARGAHTELRWVKRDERVGRFDFKDGWNGSLVFRF